MVFRENIVCLLQHIFTIFLLYSAPSISILSRSTFCCCNTSFKRMAFYNIYFKILSVPALAILLPCAPTSSNSGLSSLIHTAAFTLVTPERCLVFFSSKSKSLCRVRRQLPGHREQSFVIHHTHTDIGAAVQYQRVGSFKTAL